MIKQIVDFSILQNRRQLLALASGWTFDGKEAAAIMSFINKANSQVFLIPLIT